MDEQDVRFETQGSNHRATVKDSPVATDFLTQKSQSFIFGYASALVQAQRETLKNNRSCDNIQRFDCAHANRCGG